jgi:hypothetical protein
MPNGGVRQQATPVRIELTQTQINEIVRAKSDDISAQLAGLHRMRQAIHEALSETESTKRMSHSLLLGLLLLTEFPEDRRYLSVTRFAREQGLNASTVHRYLATLHTVGLLDQDPATRKYRLAK